MDVIEAFYDAERVFTTLPASATDTERTAAKDKWLSFVDEKDFVLYQSPDLPWGGEWKGREGFSEWITYMNNLVSKIDVQSHDILGNESGTTVLVNMTVHWTLRRSGKDLITPMSQVWTIDPIKKSVIGLRPFYWNVKLFNELLGTA